MAGSRLADLNPGSSIQRGEIMEQKSSLEPKPVAIHGSDHPIQSVFSWMPSCSAMSAWVMPKAAAFSTSARWSAAAIPG
jgi:hypothetical protein